MRQNPAFYRDKSLSASLQCSLTYLHLAAQQWSLFQFQSKTQKDGFLKFLSETRSDAFRTWKGWQDPIGSILKDFSTDYPFQMNILSDSTITSDGKNNCWHKLSIDLSNFFRPFGLFLWLHKYIVVAGVWLAMEFSQHV